MIAIKKKKLAGFLLATTMIVSLTLTTASAATKASDLNRGYWPIQAEYESALNNDDYSGIITAALKAYELFVGAADPEALVSEYLKNEDVEINILSSYMLEASKAAEILEDYDEMVRLYKLFLPFGRAYMQKMPTAEERLDYQSFVIEPTETKIKSYSVNPIFFTEIAADETSNVYTGGKFEPRNGIYYGTVNPYKIEILEGNPLIASNPKSPSGALVYVVFKDEEISQFDWLIKELTKKVDIIEVAWNIEESTAALENASKEIKHIQDMANYLAKLDTPIILRVAAEMNVWNPPADPEAFKNFYITVANIMRESAPNVAMLFSPNEGSALGVTIMDYYPGDEYVDWVGLSNYYQYYFLGQRDTSNADRATYLTAEYANPISKLAEIVELFGGRKPIMLSEYGIANYSNALGEETVSWAAHRLRQLQYYVPMLYPEIKAMFYFDVERPSEANNYALKNQPAMNQLYNELMNNGIYIPAGSSGSEWIYSRIGKEGVTVSANNVIINAYADVMNCPELTVSYSIEGVEHASANQIPYRVSLDMSAFDDGAYNIDVTINASDKEYKKTFSADKNGEAVTLYDLS